MSVLSAILQHSRTEQALKPSTALPQATTTPTPPASSSSSSASAANSDSSLISANDFLTLLVTEMQNQDPTADTDPNEYINQLVQVNSLEQLININQTLTTAFTPTTPTTTTDATAQPSLATTSSSNPAAKTPQPTAGGSLSTLATSLSSKAAASKAAAIPNAAGNFTVPTASPAALRVAHSLNGQPHAPPLKKNSTQTYPPR
jgi:flagellar basal-body rod modification protein FlgD